MPAKNHFRNQVVVITGATGGVGRATAREFARQGAKVVLLARGEEQLAATEKEVRSLGGQALGIQTDVADPLQVEAAAREAELFFGPIDVWVNNAMASVFAPIKEIKPEEFKRVTEVTYLGQVYGTMAALKRMLPRDRGSIILVGSALAYRGIPLQSAYCGAKHGIEGFYDSLRCELLHDKSHIRTCMVQLPAMNTTQFGWVLSRLPGKPRPMGKIYQPEVAAEAILYAASHERRSFWVGLSTYQAIIGNKIAPGYADRVLARTGYQGQQTKQPVSPDRKDNVWQPVAEDRGEHGDFSDISANKSFTLWGAQNRIAIGITVALALIGALIVRSKRER
jgi:NAD(P)-dependent dehydrogenase (short-subunit alcohol dehydrogenase family)